MLGILFRRIHLVRIAIVVVASICEGSVTCSLLPRVKKRQIFIGSWCSTLSRSKCGIMRYRHMKKFGKVSGKAVGTNSQR